MENIEKRLSAARTLVNVSELGNSNFSIDALSSVPDFNNYHWTTDDPTCEVIYEVINCIITGTSFILLAELVELPVLDRQAVFEALRVAYGIDN